MRSLTTSHPKPTTQQVDQSAPEPSSGITHRRNTGSSRKATQPIYSSLRHTVDILRTASPTSMSAHPADSVQSLADSPVTTRWKILQHLISSTFLWVFGGIAFMVLGIGLTQVVLFPRIHTCPPSATCRGSYDLDNGNALQLLQSFMSYWLQAGVMLASVGILKLSAYQAWFILMHEGNTVKDLDLNLGAIRGSVTDTFLLLFRKNNRLLSIFVFALIGVNTAISLITGLSIQKQNGTKRLEFTYNATSNFPDSRLKNMNNVGQLMATQKAISWALSGDNRHGGALRGSLVVPDDRSIEASLALPAGPKISGRFTCEGVSNYTFDPKSAAVPQWYINVHGLQFIATSVMSLDTSVVVPTVDTAVASYVWVSNTTGLIPNATTTDDGGMNIALCTHWVEMEPEGQRKDGFDYLNANEALTSGCDVADPDTCVSDSVSNAILNWWGGAGTAFWHISCRGGVLAPIPPSNSSERYCSLTQDLWKETTVTMLDGIMQTAPTSIASFQTLQAVVGELNRSRWWLNAVIPAGTFVLYLAGLAYTCFRSQGDLAFKELNLDEVIKAGQTDHIHDLIVTGQLKKTRVRYNSEMQGFIQSSSLSVMEPIISRVESMAKSAPHNRA